MFLHYSSLFTPYYCIPSDSDENMFNVARDIMAPK